MERTILHFRQEHFTQDLADQALEILLAHPQPIGGPHVELASIVRGLDDVLSKAPGAEASDGEIQILRMSLYMWLLHLLKQHINSPRMKKKLQHRETLLLVQERRPLVEEERCEGKLKLQEIITKHCGLTRVAYQNACDELDEIKDRGLLYERLNLLCSLPPEERERELAKTGGRLQARNDRSLRRKDRSLRGRS